MKRNNVVRVGGGILAVAAVVLSTAGACGGGEPPAPQTPEVKSSSANPAPNAPAQKPADGIPNNGDGDADG